LLSLQIHQRGEAVIHAGAVERQVFHIAALHPWILVDFGIHFIRCNSWGVSLVVLGNEVIGEGFQRGLIGKSMFPQSLENRMSIR
jgi:hypothetical protein